MQFLTSLFLADPAFSVRLIQSLWWARIYLKWLWQSRLRPAFVNVRSAV